MLGPDEVRKVALLARLELGEDEVKTMTEQLSRIIDYVHQLDEANTEGVEPVAHVLDLVNVFGDDQARESLSRDQALANAPKRDEACFRVPAVLGE